MPRFSRLALLLFLPTLVLTACGGMSDEVSSLQRADFVTTSTMSAAEKASFTERCRRVAADPRVCGCVAERYGMSTKLDRLLLNAALRDEVGVAFTIPKQAERVGLGRAELRAVLARSKQKSAAAKAACSA